MTDSLKITLAQLNPTMGDISGNADKARAARKTAAAQGADLIVFSELFLIGYPPEDLVLKQAFQDASDEMVAVLAKETADGGPAMLIGAPWREDGKLYNAVLLLDRGEVAAVRYKRELPNYGVFDEVRLFEQGPLPGPINFRDIRIGVPVCEDIWFEDVCECLEETGAEILIVPNGSPFEADKTDQRINMTVARVLETGLPLIYVNQVGGQDELVFDGGGFVLNADRSLALQQPSFAPSVVTTSWTRGDKGWTCAEGEKAETEQDLAAIYQALVLGIRDYVGKNGFPGVVLGLSGGIDSGLSAALAADALGPENVHCIRLPSKYSSQHSLDDAAQSAELIGCPMDDVAIEPAVAAFEEMLAPIFGDREPDIAEENIQSRARGLILMAVSNKLGHMVLTTGNKSEMSVGYATLYGDMNGGFNALKDLYKLQVFALCHWRNQNFPKGALGPKGRVIPENTISKPPSAELRPDQKDEDSLPPYEALDDILECLVEKELSFEDIVARGHAPDVVRRIEHLLYISEYKRRQSAPGVKITSRNFGRDRRYPITNRFRDATI